MKFILLSAIIISVIIFHGSCKDSSVSSNIEMASMLQSIFKMNDVPENTFSSTAKTSYYDSIIRSEGNRNTYTSQYYRAAAYLESGKEEQSIEYYQKLLEKLPAKEISARRLIMKDMAIAWMRVGERTNCIKNHGSESCIFPIAGKGIHTDKTGSQKAIEIYQALLNEDTGDLESKWLLNIAYMTINGHPSQVPKKYLLNFPVDTSASVKPFIDAAIVTGLNTNNLAGGSIVEDFNNDGFLDVITSSMSLTQGMHYCQNNGNGTFTDISELSGLSKLTGGLNMMQTDYNNDGLKDIFITRGGWKQKYGMEPNSLLRNNGDGTFTDVTKESGLLSFHPTQTATWADFNNDGWLDVFIGNEPISSVQNSASEFYINNGDGTFSERALAANVRILQYVKGVNAGDYDNDGLIDLFISTMTGNKILFKNKGIKNGVPDFLNVSRSSGVSKNMTPSFSTWFFDYDNDGWLDIIACGYKFESSLAYYAGAEAEGNIIPNSGQPILFRNKQDGTFEEVTEKAGLNKIAYGMGSNFGDIDNDGFLDFYLGTGNPNYSSLIPNKLFRNNNGNFFEDITSVARVGNLQKGHGVSFADLDNDGDEDIHIDLGGAFEGDTYQNSFYINPGQNDNHWINLSFRGVKSNTAAIGTRIKITFKENNTERSVYRVVTSGSSFGANPLMQHIGIGKAEKVDRVEIKWPATGTVQVFNNIGKNKTLLVTEGEDKIVEKNLTKINFLDPNRQTIGCTPLVKKTDL